MADFKLKPLDDRIIVQAALPGRPEELARRLAPGGALVYVWSEKKAGEKRPRQRLIKLDRSEGGDWRESDLGAHSLGVATFGLAKSL